MHRRMRIAAATAALALLALTGCGSGGENHLGTVYTVEPLMKEPLDRVEGPAAVDQGKRFSIAVLRNVSAHREWKPAAAQPPGGIVRSVGSSSHQTEEERESDGSGFTVYFTYEALKPGKTDLVFANRCGNPEERCHSPGVLRTLTYHITVR
ncbi:protease inhibitor I42 family protein [Streptomyces sp. URMC 126]|uniref:protease inhibitor I42 family protein n=1 Tax=Streptomyces sp. URMC 126 TaxID=3423401 RepID=UPI003F1BCADC